MIVDHELQVIREFVPEFRIREKKDSWIHRTIGKIWKRYQSYWTTIGYTAWSSGYVESSIIYHEGLHAIQAKKLSRVLFALLYLFPQCLSLPFFVLALAFLDPWMLIPAVVLLCPLPAPWRLSFELRAQGLTAMVLHWKYGANPHTYVNDLADDLCGSSYYFSSWSKKRTRKKLSEYVDALVLEDRAGEMSDPYLDAIREADRVDWTRLQ